jgi:hypothetical protein
MLTMKLSIKKQPFIRQDYQLTLISAITQDKIIANQVIQGGVDAVVFENFIYQMLFNLV